jgi:CheY-like chemotaxis protein
MDYLYRRGKYAQHACSPPPHLILLDLNMPRKDGREAISEIEADPDLGDIRRSYNGGKLLHRQAGDV